MKKYIENFKKYKFLLTELVKKDIKLKYRRSKFGILWTLIEPILTTIVLTVVFGAIRNKGDRDFPVYILTGRLLFQFFSQGTKAAARSIRTHHSMMRKVYIPKYMYPLGSVLSNFITFLISIVVLIGALFIYETPITGNVVLAIVPLVILFVMTFGVSLILATAQVFFRDVEYLWGVITTLIMYCSGIFYKLEDIVGSSGHGTLQMVLKWNPVYATIYNFRCAVYYGKPLDLWYVGYGSVVAVLSVVIGVYLFYKKQDEFILHL